MNRSPLNSGLTLAETIQEIGSEKAVVGIDVANANFWPRYIDNPEGTQFSLDKLSEYLKQIQAIKKRYLFTAKYNLSFNNPIAKKVIDLIEKIEPASLKRAEVERGGEDVSEYGGRFYDLESILIIAEEMVDAGKVENITQGILNRIANLKYQLGFNKALSKRKNQGYEIVTADYRVYKNVVPEMDRIKSLAKYAASVNGIKRELVGEQGEAEEGVVGLRDNLKLAESKLQELTGITTMGSYEDLVELLQTMSTQAKRVHGELVKIIDIAESKAVETVRKSNADSYLVAEIMDKKAEVDTVVIFSGDGDFRLMYNKFLEEEKKVVVVSPTECLNSNLKKIVLEGRISLVNALNDDQFWKVPKRIR